MRAIEQALVSFFEQVARKDEAWLKALKRDERFAVGEERWRFTLPDLHLFLQHRDDVFSCIDYKQFRQLIFDSPINQTVKLHGAEIIIADNRANVNKSSYALVWQSRDSR